MYQFVSDKQKWEPIFRSAPKLHLLTEYELVKRGYRKAAIVYLPLKKMEKFISCLKKDGLFFTILHEVAPFSGFMNQHKLPKINDEKIYRVVITKTKKEEEIFKNAHFEANEKLKGEMLGYPECCCDFFEKQWKAGIYDPLWETAINSGDPINNYIKINVHPYTNLAMRYFGIRIASHIPCSFNCRKSLKKGEIWFKIMREINYEMADKIFELLSFPLIWKNSREIATVKHKVVHGSVGTFNYDKEKIIEINFNQ